MERPGPEAFRSALERLGRSAAEAARALEQLGQALDALAWETYAWHGCPFGRDRKALDLWLTYAQYTTPR